VFKIFPVTFTNDGRKVPVKGFKWREDCTSDQNIIASWSITYPQLKLYGIPCGPENGILVLDIDVKGGGLETIKKYHVPLTMSQTTLSGGKHHVYKYPNDGFEYGNKVGIDSGIDVRGRKGYIAHYNLDQAPIVDAPSWLLDACRVVEKEAINLEDAVKVSSEIAQQSLEESCENIRNAPEGEANNTLNIEAYKIGQILHSIDRQIAYDALFKAAKDRGREDYEAQATINSGFSGGSKSPITSPFGNEAPILTIPEFEEPETERWTPRFFRKSDLTNTANLRKPQLFENWSTEDISITTADGGTGKTTLKLIEAIQLALGEDFLGFKCNSAGRTLFITGEDTVAKLGAMLGAILKQMGLMDGTPENEIKVRKVMDNVLIKKDADLCLIDKGKNGFINVNNDALTKVLEAVDDLKPRMIVFDPISSFWGSESALNDMAKAVSKFMGVLVERGKTNVEIINHMGKASSSTKDMSQFAGRGGTGLPSHARVSKVLRPVDDAEYEELTGFCLQANTSAIMCNVNKFSDGSPLYNKPFLLVREGYLFSKVTLIEQKVKEETAKNDDTERVFAFIQEERQQGRYPNKSIITSTFMASSNKLSKDRVSRAIDNLNYYGHLGNKVKSVDNPDIEVGGKVYVITDMEGREEYVY